MYILVLLLTAFFLISIFATNWPVKLYHHTILTRLAELLDAVPEKNGMLLSNVYSQINTIYRGWEIKIRFLEASIDSLKANSGLEIRMYLHSPDCAENAILEFYPMRQKKREWGDFKRFLTNDPQIDNHWFALTNNTSSARECWNSFDFKKILFESGVVQVLLNQHELIIQLRYHGSVKKIMHFINELVIIDKPAIV
ncbi:MAG TPA: hypothetical protein DDW50_00490 [Firmicutes bacterium]|jgi:hypothetical protein|nr:hypothetical protein [Bacillota bacterium]